MYPLWQRLPERRVFGQGHYFRHLHMPEMSGSMARSMLKCGKLKLPTEIGAIRQRPTHPAKVKRPCCGGGDAAPPASRCTNEFAWQPGVVNNNAMDRGTARQCPPSCCGIRVSRMRHASPSRRAAPGSSLMPIA